MTVKELVKELSADPSIQDRQIWISRNDDDWTSFFSEVEVEKSETADGVVQKVIIIGGVVGSDVELQYRK